MDPRAVRAQASLPALFRPLLFCGGARIRTLTCPDSHNWSRLFQLGVPVSPVDSLGNLSQQQATTVAAEPGTGDRSWLLRDLLPKPWRSEKTTHRGSAMAEARRRAQRAAARLSQLGPTSRMGAVRSFQRFSWRHWLRALRGLLPGCQTTGRCVPDAQAVVCPEKVFPNAKLVGEE